MVRTVCGDKSGLKKGKWTPEEDRKLIAYVSRYGHWNWRLLPKFAGLARCGKSCRLRWLNYLRPNVKRGNYTREEEETIIKLHQRLGNRWSAIAAQMPGRTDNEIKNHWHTILKKRVQQNSITHEKAQVPSKSKDQAPVEPMPNNIIGPIQSLPATTQFADSCSFSQHYSPSTGLSSISTDHAAVSSNENLVLEDEFAFLDPDTYPMNGNFWLEPYMLDISYFPSEIQAPATAPLVAEPEFFSPELLSPDNLYGEYTGNAVHEEGHLYTA